jgi:hypothetical protein
MSKWAFQEWQDSLPDDEREPDDRAQFEDWTLHALRTAARDLAALGWQAHDLANEVAEAVAPSGPPIDQPPTAAPFAA